MGGGCEDLWIVRVVEVEKHDEVVHVCPSSDCGMSILEMRGLGDDRVRRAETALRLDIPKNRGSPAFTCWPNRKGT